MKKIMRISLRIFFVLLIIIVCIVSYIKLALPNVGAAPKFTVERTPERIAAKRMLYNRCKRIKN
jgi:uncharacterized protein YhdP